MSQPEQVEFKDPAVKLERKLCTAVLDQISPKDAFMMLPMHKSLMASIAATQLQPMTVPSGRTIGPL